MKQTFFSKAILSIFTLSLAINFIPNTAQALTVTPRWEVEGDPGQSFATTVKVTNEERQTRTFYLRSENFNSQDETGSPTFIARQEDLATWIKAPASITLGPGETIDIPVTIDIPYNAEPGGHYAAIFFLTEPPSVTDQQGKVALSGKLGTLILLRVSGDFIQNADIVEFATTNHQKVFTQLPIQFYFRFQNTGEDHQKPLGDIIIKNIYGGVSKIVTANTVDGSVLPKSIRRFTTVWSEFSGRNQTPLGEMPKVEPQSYWQAVKYQATHFMIGRYKADLKLAFGSKGLKSEHAIFVFYVIPWQLLSIAVPILIILLFILRRLIKRYNRYIIAQASKARS